RGDAPRPESGGGGGRRGAHGGLDCGAATGGAVVGRPTGRREVSKTGLVRGRQPLPDPVPPGRGRQSPARGRAGLSARDIGPGALGRPVVRRSVGSARQRRYSRVPRPRDPVYGSTRRARRLVSLPPPVSSVPARPPAQDPAGAYSRAASSGQ